MSGRDCRNKAVPARREGWKKGVWFCLFLFKVLRKFDLCLNICKLGHGEKSLKKRNEDNPEGELCRIGKELITGLDGDLVTEELVWELPFLLCWCSRKAQLGFPTL